MANHGIKVRRAIENAEIFKGRETVRQIMKNVPDSAIEQLSSKALTDVIEAVNKAFHEGRAFEYHELEQDGWLKKSCLDED